MNKNCRDVFHPFLETIGLIYLMKNWGEVREETIGSLEAINIEGERFYKKNLIYLEDLIKTFESQYVPDSEEEFFFEYNTEFFLVTVAVGVDYLETEQAEKPVTKEKILSCINRFFAKEEDEAIPELDTIEKQVAVIEDAELSKDTKWKMLMLMRNPQERFQSLFEIYRKNRDAYVYTIEQNQGVLQKLLEQASGHLSLPMEHLLRGEGEKKIKVYSTAVFPLIEWVVFPYVFQGILIDKLNFWRRDGENIRDMLPVLLKILGDKSKFEILYSLKEKDKYNLEIAEELKLTPATASHHMGILLSNHFVTVEKREGKVYYQLNREAVEKIVEYLQAVLLD